MDKINRTLWPLLGSIAVTLVGAFGPAACSGEVSCGTSNKLDSKKAEKLLVDHYAKIEASIQKVSCPPDLRKKKDATFICNVTAANGDILEAEFKQTDSKGHVELTRQDTIIRNKALVASLRGLIAKNPVMSKLTFEEIDCPKDHKAVKDKTFECEGKASDSATYKLKIEETDDKGAFTFGFAGVAVPAAGLAKKLADEFAKQKLGAEVNCGTTPVLLREKQVVECKARDAKGLEATVELIPSNNVGSFDWRIKK